MHGVKLVIIMMLIAGASASAQLTNYPVDDERMAGTPEKIPAELQFIGYSFHRYTATNIASTNELLRAQIIGRLFGRNTTTTLPQTSAYGDRKSTRLNSSH